jgi:hypothetical protein
MTGSFIETATSIVSGGGSPSTEWSNQQIRLAELRPAGSRRQVLSDKSRAEIEAVG